MKRSVLAIGAAVAVAGALAGGCKTSPRQAEFVSQGGAAGANGANGANGADGADGTAGQMPHAGLSSDYPPGYRGEGREGGVRAGDRAGGAGLNAAGMGDSVGGRTGAAGSAAGGSATGARPAWAMTPARSDGGGAMAGGLHGSDLPAHQGLAGIADLLRGQGGGGPAERQALAGGAGRAGGRWDDGSSPAADSQASSVARAAARELDLLLPGVFGGGRLDAAGGGMKSQAQPDLPGRGMGGQGGGTEAWRQGDGVGAGAGARGVSIGNLGGIGAARPETPRAVGLGMLLDGNGAGGAAGRNAGMTGTIRLWVEGGSRDSGYLIPGVGTSVWDRNPESLVCLRMPGERMVVVTAAEAMAKINATPGAQVAVVGLPREAMERGEAAIAHGSPPVDLPGWDEQAVEAGWVDSPAWRQAEVERLAAERAALQERLLKAILGRSAGEGK